MDDPTCCGEKEEVGESQIGDENEGGLLVVLRTGQDADERRKHCQV